MIYFIVIVVIAAVLAAYVLRPQKAPVDSHESQIQYSSNKMDDFGFCAAYTELYDGSDATIDAATVNETVRAYSAAKSKSSASKKPAAKKKAAAKASTLKKKTAKPAVKKRATAKKTARTTKAR